MYVIQLNHFVNELDAGKAVLLGLADDIGVSTTGDTEEVNVDRHVRM